MLMRTLAAATAAGALLLPGVPAHAVGAVVDVRVMDRSTGAALPLYWHDGKWWVAGTPGSRYAVNLVNRGSGRTLAVISVDGVNVISGDAAAPEQSGYVLASGQSAQITGWRKSLARVAAFEFTALANSYAARTGRPENVGVIGVAVFRERVRYVPPPLSSSREPASKEAAPYPSSPAAADSNDTAGSTEAARRSERAAQQARIGTGHGRSEHSPTSYTQFERVSPTPDEVVTIHYDSRENLMAMGAIPVRRSTPNPFPAAVGFVPDPSRR
jgi:hypothetical protein